MSWGIDFNTDIYLSHQSYTSKLDVRDKINELEEEINEHKSTLKMYAASTPKDINTKILLECYREYYRDKPFVAVIDRSPNTTDVRGTNKCEIRPAVDERTGKMFVISVIDNLVKGQSGNAVQCANIILGFDEKAGLECTAFYP